jgi:putative transposase
MTNHVHLISSSEAKSLSGIRRDLKRHTAKELLRTIEKNTQESRREWMRGPFERAGQRHMAMFAQRAEGR